MKNFKKILLLLICCFFNVSFCYAAASINVGFNDPDAGDTEGGESNETDDDGKINDSITLDNGYTCSYDYKIEYFNDIVIDGFNQQNKSIINGKVTPTEFTKAGMSIGISIIESKSTKWTYNYKVTRKVYEGTGVWNFTCVDDTVIPEVTYYEYDVVEGTQKYLEMKALGCTGKEEKNYVERPVDDASINETCESTVKTKVENIAKSFVNMPSYNNIKLLNPNDAKKNNDKFVIKSNGCENSELGESSYSCKHTYSPKYICMDILSGEVTYSNDKECDPENEFQIKNDELGEGDNKVEHFHYFIPMNVTSGWFSLIFDENEEKKSASWCEKAIEKNSSNYADFFVAAPAIEGGETIPLTPDNKKQAIKEVANGCYIKTEIRIPVSDGYYNIVSKDGANEIEGFNFYVNTVNEFNPFPNPILNTDSLWYEWYQQNYDASGKYAYNKIKPNFKTSFSEISYLLENVDADSIRNLNDDLGSYFNSKVDKNGKSDFIGIDGLFSKKVMTNSYYKLGCGPVNANEKLSDGSDNLFYQKGCK